MGAIQQIRDEIAEIRATQIVILEALKDRGVAVQYVSHNSVYKLRDAAKLLNVSLATLRRWRQTGRLICVEHNPAMATGAQLIAAVNDRRVKIHAIKNRKRREHERE